MALEETEHLIPPDTALHKDEDKSTINTQFSLLYVEDDPVVQRSFYGLLTYSGFQVDTASNGQEALDKYYRNNYDAIVLDGGLPVLSGFEIGKRIREHELATGCKRIPLILLSAYPYETVRRECSLAGIDEFLSKTGRINDLLEALHRRLNESIYSTHISNTSVPIPSFTEKKETV